jgi:hypothetical protein
MRGAAMRDGARRGARACARAHSSGAATVDFLEYSAQNSTLAPRG